MSDVTQERYGKCLHSYVISAFLFLLFKKNLFFLMKILSFQESLVGFHRLARTTFCG